MKFRSNMSVELIDWMGSESRIVQAAQVSTKGAGATAAKNPGLVGWLYREKHASPFEHCVMTFRIEAPIFVTREILRHRLSSFNEESGRYRVLKGVFYSPNGDRKLKQIGKVGNYEFVKGTRGQQILTWVSTHVAPSVAWAFYRTMIRAGVSREVARMVLPVSIYSSMYYTANLRSILNFLSLRKDWGEDAATRSHPQAEIDEVATKIALAVANKFPTVWKSFVENGYQSV